MHPQRLLSVFIFAWNRRLRLPRNCSLPRSLQKSPPPSPLPLLGSLSLPPPPPNVESPSLLSKNAIKLPDVKSPDLPNSRRQLFDLLLHFLLLSPPLHRNQFLPLHCPLSLLLLFRTLEAPLHWPPGSYSNLGAWISSSWPSSSSSSSSSALDCCSCYPSPSSSSWQALEDKKSNSGSFGG